MLWDTRINLNQCNVFLTLKNGQGFDPCWQGIGNEIKGWIGKCGLCWGGMDDGQGNRETEGRDQDKNVTPMWRATHTKRRPMTLFGR